MIIEVDEVEKVRRCRPRATVVAILVDCEHNLMLYRILPLLALSGGFFVGIPDNNILK